MPQKATGAASTPTTGAQAGHGRGPFRSISSTAPEKFITQPGVPQCTAPRRWPEFVDRLGEQSKGDTLGVGLETVALGSQPMGRYQSDPAAEVGFAEHEGEDRREEIDVGHAQDRVVVTREAFDRGHESTAVVLTAGPDEGVTGIDRSRLHHHRETQERRQTRGEVGDEDVESLTDPHQSSASASAPSRLSPYCLILLYTVPRSTCSTRAVSEMFQRVSSSTDRT